MRKMSILLARRFKPRGVGPTANIITADSTPSKHEDDVDEGRECRDERFDVLAKYTLG